MRFILIAIILALTACGATAAQTALEIVSPIAVRALEKLVAERWGTEVDKQSAGCFPLPEFEDEDDYVYVLCRAKGVEK